MINKNKTPATTNEEVRGERIIKEMNGFESLLVCLIYIFTPFPPPPQFFCFFFKKNIVVKGRGDEFLFICLEITYLHHLERQEVF